MEIRTVKVSVVSFEYESQGSHGDTGKGKETDSSINFSRVKAPEIDLEANEGIISATTNFSFATSKFRTSGRVSGIFIIPKDASEAIEDGDDSQLDKIQDVSKQLVQRLMMKFRMYTALFSGESDSNVIIPEFTINTDHMKHED